MKHDGAIFVSPTFKDIILDYGIAGEVLTIGENC